jgi:hypothetical protein
MSRPDSELVKLARRWIKGLYPIGNFVMGVSSPEGWRVQYVFYQSLLSIGCKVVGRSGSEVYMRCGDKLVGLALDLLFSEDEDLMKQIRELGEEEEKRLTGGVPYVMFMFDSIYIEVYGAEPIEVMKLTQGSIFVEPLVEGIRQSIPLEGPVDLYLNRVELKIEQQESSFCIWLEPRGATKSPIDLIETCYEFEEGAKARRYIVVSAYDDAYNLADKEAERSILGALNGKSSVIDELISQAVSLLHEPLKWLGIYALY